MSAAATSLHELPAFLLAAVHDFLDSACILAITDVRGTIVFVNDAFVSISGYPRAELIGQNHRILKSGEHSSEFYRGMWQTIARGETWRGEICNRAKDGHLYWVDSLLTPIRDRAGQIAYYCALRVDVTEQKRLQKALIEKVRHDAETDRLAVLGRMADGICHDLNNMLSGAMLMADLMPSTLGAEETEPLRAVLARMSQMVRNLRDFSTGRPAEMRRFDLRSLVTDACKLAGYRAVRTGEVQLSFRLDAIDSCVVEGNESQILEIVLNLVTNAVEALAGRPDAAIEVSGQVDSAGRAHVRFQDNGPGIPEALRASVFEAFTSTKGPGRGIGLSASQALARAHQGDLQLLDSPAGACFSLILPVVQRRRTTPVPSVNHGVLLLMEDESDIVLGIQEAAGRRGYRVIPGTSSDEMLHWVSTFSDTLAGAVLDSAGTSDDHALVGALRALRADLPIVLISANLSSRGIRQTRHGPVICLPKPFRFDELLTAVADAGGPVPI